MGAMGCHRPAKSAGSTKLALINASHPFGKLRVAVSLFIASLIDPLITLIVLPRFLQVGKRVLMRKWNGESEQQMAVTRLLRSNEI